MKTIKIITGIIGLSIFIHSCKNESKEQASEQNHSDNVKFENVNTDAMGAVSPNATEFVVQGNFKNAPNKNIYLYVWAGQEPDVMDSSLTDEQGNFKLKGIGEGYQFYGVGDSPVNMKLLLLNSKGTVELNGDLNDLFATEVEGSIDTKILDEFTKKQKEFYTQMQTLQNELKTLPNGQNSPEGKAIVEKSDNITKEYTDYVKRFIDNNLNSPAVLAAANDLFDIESQKAYLPKIEHALSNTMKGSAFHQHIKTKIEQIGKQQPQQPQNGNLKPGMTAHEINLPSPSGKKIALSSLRGKVVLIDFWASWCRPCRMENPNVVRLYNKYKDKGFTVYSVSLDKKNKDRWVNAIQQDGLIWPNHVSDLKGWQSEAAATYGVRAIPYTVLIDKEGKVIATNLRGAELEKKLEEILG